MYNWLHLLYKLPSHPSKLRVSVWRKMKRLGAILLHESVWCLPNTPKTKEHFQWMVEEIDELGGEASLWESRSLMGGQDDLLIKEFIDQVDKEYHEILDEINKEQPNLPTLAHRYHQIISRDYFQSELGKRVWNEFIQLKGSR